MKNVAILMIAYPEFKNNFIKISELVKSLIKLKAILKDEFYNGELILYGFTGEFEFSRINYNNLRKLTTYAPSYTYSNLFSDYSDYRLENTLNGKINLNLFRTDHIRKKVYIPLANLNDILPLDFLLVEEEIKERLAEKILRLLKEYSKEYMINKEITFQKASQLAVKEIYFHDSFYFNTLVNKVTNANPEAKELIERINRVIQFIKGIDKETEKKKTTDQNQNQLSIF